jgi:hypothetical protein
MKKTIYLILALTATLVISCNNPKNATIENPYAGAWVITYTKYIFPDSTNETTQFTNPSVKLLTKKHFSFGYQSGTNRVVGGGGEYSYEGDSYTETIKYHLYSSLIGKTVNFKSKIEGDLWTINYSMKIDSLKVDGTETWKRIVE